MQARARRLDLTACDREPIHVPGSIQPHGVLLVVDASTEVVLQAAGNTALIFDHPVSVLGKTAYEVLGTSLADLLKQSQTELLREATYVAHDARAELGARGVPPDGPEPPTDSSGKIIPIR